MRKAPGLWLGAALVLGGCTGYLSAGAAPVDGAVADGGAFDAGAGRDGGAAALPPLVLAERGQTAYTIVVSAQATAVERFAADELATWLAATTGATFARADERGFDGGAALYVGHTAFAAAHQVPLDTLGPEEWFAAAEGPSLIVAGGRPRGTLYAALEFLERAANVRFLTAQRTVAPHVETLKVPADFALRGQPAFAQRTVFTLAGGDGSAAHNLYRVRRKLTTNATEYPLEPRFGDTLLFGRPYHTHTHHLYSAGFPPGHPEYFALLPNGSRASNGPDGQVDLTNPSVRQLFTQQLRSYILQDRLEAAQAGLPPPTVYDLTPNDNENKCTCPACAALAARHGSYAGVVLDFTNDIAERIAGEFPEVTLQTSAYTFYSVAPQGIAPRSNVLVKVAQLGGEFWATPQRDTLRSMLHPVNASARARLEAWARLSPALGVHDYWTPWMQMFLWPYANVHGLAETLALYRRQGVRNVYVENELFGSRVANFVDLQLYVGARLLVEPTLAPEPLIDEFLEGVYGPAAPQLRELLHLLETAQQSERGVLATVHPAERLAHTPQFFLRAAALLSEAEGLVASDPERRAAVRQERLAFDETTLFLWEDLSARASGSWAFDRAATLARLQEGYAAAYAKYGDWGAALRADDARRLELLSRAPAIPSGFSGERVIDLVGPLLQLATAGPARRVADPEGAFGEAWKLDASLGGAAGDHAQAPQLGLYEPATGQVQTRRIEPADLPTDERYHWYLVARARASPQLTLWAHHSWWLSTPLSVAMNGSRDTQREFEVYASLKLEGPAYVAGSSRLSAFSVDRVLLVSRP